MKMTTTTSNPGLTVRSIVHFSRSGQGRMKLHAGSLPLTGTVPTGRVPRVARLMALALRFEDLLRRGEVADYADLARLGHVTRARLTQIMNLLMLAPDIQEQLLFLPSVEEGRDLVKEWQVRPIAAELVWAQQRRMWGALRLGDLVHH